MGGTSLVQEDAGEVNALFSKINVLNELCTAGPSQIQVAKGPEEVHRPNPSLASHPEENTSFSQLSDNRIQERILKLTTNIAEINENGSSQGKRSVVSQGKMLGGSEVGVHREVEEFKSLEIQIEVESQTRHLASHDQGSKLIIQNEPSLNNKPTKKQESKGRHTAIPLPSTSSRS